MTLIGNSETSHGAICLTATAQSIHLTHMCKPTVAVSLYHEASSIFVILDNRYHKAGYQLAQLILGLVIQL